MAVKEKNVNSSNFLLNILTEKRIPGIAARIIKAFKKEKKGKKGEKFLATT